MSRIIKTIIAAVLPALLIAVLNSCLNDPKTGNSCCPDWPFKVLDPIGSPPEISSVPDTIEVEGTLMYLSSELWRNFMPMTLPDCTRLTAFINIIDCDSVAIPSRLDAECIWVLNGDEVWGSRFNDEELQSSPEYQISKIARCGPKWETNIYVDVIVKILHGDDIYYIRQREVRIMQLE